MGTRQIRTGTTSGESWNGTNWSAFLSVTTAVGDTGLVICTVDRSGPATVYYNGVPLTKLVGGSDGNSGSSGIWLLANPPIGTFNLETRSSDFKPGIEAFAVTGPFTVRAVTATTGFNNSPTVSGLVVGDLIITTCFQEVTAGTIVGPTSGQTLLASGVVDTYGNKLSVAYFIATGTSYTSTWNVTSPNWGGHRVAVLIPGSTAATFAATPSASASVSASLQTGVNLAATPSASGTAAAALQVGAWFAATPNASASSSAALQVGAWFAATPNASTTGAAALLVGARFATTVTISAAGSANLLAGARFAATLVTSATLTANLLSAIWLASALSVRAQAFADLLSPSHLPVYTPVALWQTNIALQPWSAEAVVLGLECSVQVQGHDRHAILWDEDFNMPAIANRFAIRQHDFGPMARLLVQLLGPDDQPAVLDPAGTYTFTMWKAGTPTTDPPAISGAAADVVDVGQAIIGYEFADGETLLAGTYEGVMREEVTGVGATSYPSRRNIVVEIVPTRAPVRAPVPV